MKKYLCTLLLWIPSLVYALADAGLSWKCTLNDSNNLSWSNESVFKRKAANSVFDSCKSQSTDPASCKIGNARCDSYINGMTNTPMWQCMALDSNANFYYGDIATERDEAALNARGKCAQQSIIPATCYMFLMACTNRNMVK